MSAKAIYFDQTRKDYLFDTQSVRTEQIGRKIANALSNGQEFVEFNCLTVSVNYLLEMLRFVGKHGWFCDRFDLCVEDHEFDRNRITPGANWAEVQRLRSEVRELTKHVRLARAAHYESDAVRLEGEIREKRGRIRELLSGK